MADFDLNMDFEFEFEDDQELIHNPLRVKGRTNKYINYTNAVQLARRFDIKRNTRSFSFVSGNFIFGDLIEALMVEKNWECEQMQISTLSLSEDNIFNLQNLILGGYVHKLDLIISDYFFAHERHDLIRKIYDLLITPKCDFQLAVARTHAKICIFKVINAGDKPGYVVIQSSANLRSSDNIEQVEIEENYELYTYISDFFNTIISRYKTINKTVEGSRQDWNLINKK